MKFDLEKLNKVFDNRIRVGIMSGLMVDESLSFKDLKEYLDLTDGNLASHLKNLEDSNYITVTKGFVGRKTNTTYSATEEGKYAFKQHLAYLENIIKTLK
ncbi:transcriptional regulator [Myroides marinus]|uniref:Winged helix DNA-binding domain-containing protein n=1 Tax=Myroides marinus TaxID=703342 RepID=A0A1H6SJM2_9FLAO|nr:transcriptional regulator [Myroides marinus]KUF43380.1 transcriptional regulator [Myroides marinus]MDM1347355.1 transcriptional regulator [Myroides marinus]MDM1349675.1 transcriptional regulator [Myroides marinus]MDM1354492.1 transcriptional regulator [Myroides marinus]MDM1356884.1 transcriptional regulator [Myroides marinus]